MKKLPFSSRHLIESYEITNSYATFDNINFTLSFIPGRNNTGLIVESFKDAIQVHDRIVAEIEIKWKGLDVMKKDLAKKNRVLRNKEAAWDRIKGNQDELNEYLKLLPRMDKFEARLKTIKDKKAKEKALAERERFLELEPIFSKLMEFKRGYDAAVSERNASRELLVENEIEFGKMRNLEKILASQISDDHIVAHEKSLTLADVFPNVHVGYLLASINEKDISSFRFEEAMAFLKRINSPHNAIFRRYDHRYNHFLMRWESLGELRERGVMLDDPALSREAFVEKAARGDLAGIRLALLQGIDPDSHDFTGRTALHAAALAGYTDVVDILKRANAGVDKRDQNMMTPLLSCIRKGDLAMVGHLNSLGAESDARDQNQRGVSFYALMNGSVDVAKQFITKDNCNEVDNIWTFTPLHVAANQGNLDMAKFLVRIAASIYVKDKAGRSAEQVARDAGIGAKLVREFLEQERLTAPAQLVYNNESLRLNLWIGDETALDPEWCWKIDVTHILYIAAPVPAFGARPPSVPGTSRRSDGTHQTLMYTSTLPLLLQQDSPSLSLVTFSDLSLTPNHRGQHYPSGKRGGGSGVEYSGKGSTLSPLLPAFASWMLNDQHVHCHIETTDSLDDTDTTSESWERLESHVPDIVSFLIPVLKNGDANILICDPKGLSTGVAVAAVVLLLRFQIPTEETFASCASARPAICISQSLRAGVTALEKEFQLKRKKRHDDKMRYSTTISTAF